MQRDEGHATTDAGPERHLIRTRLDSFYQQAAATDAPDPLWQPSYRTATLIFYRSGREHYAQRTISQGRLMTSVTAQRRAWLHRWVWLLLEGATWFVAIYGTTWLAAWAFQANHHVVPRSAPMVAGALVGRFAFPFLVRNWRSRHGATGQNARRVAVLGAQNNIDDVAQPSLLGRKSVMMGLLTSGVMIAEAARPSSAAAGTIKSIAATPPPYAPIWAPATAYELGEQVVSPNNDIVSANVAHTSSTAYATDTAKWTLSSTYDRIAVDSAGAVVSTDDLHPKIWQTPGGGNWHIDTQTASDPEDHLFRRVYNYDMTAADTRRVDDVAVREALESNYFGSFEWDLDLTPKNGGTPLALQAGFRPWYYTYAWATGASRLAFKGKIFAQSNMDDNSIAAVAFSDSQTSAVFATLKADGVTGGSFSVSASSGVHIAPIDINHYALSIMATAPRKQNIVQVVVNGTPSILVDVWGRLICSGAIGFYGGAPLDTKPTLAAAATDAATTQTLANSLRTNLIALGLAQ